ncbi:hypothetical protein [Sulfuricurvum sp.]|uniref:hypothetical protein n=1 Tax=Sulfuricurvum sp. TaxID=2025608 RepID=UPI00262E32E0|nr:hypothetical protein [Sulfuricurvum sp.]MDD3596822.1 hypothetical protein [Sulfuricurvum sp.]
MEFSRSLTSGEINMLQNIFGNSINYADVKIYNSSFDRGVSIDGNIGIPSDKYHPDFSTLESTKLADQALLIHEMTHVWQSQNGYEVLETGLTLQAMYESHRDDPTIANPYDYQLDPNKTFKDYNMEQQASMMEDYFLTKDNINEDLKKLVEDFINSDQDGSWLPTQDAMLQTWKNYLDNGGKWVFILDQLVAAHFPFNNIIDAVNELWKLARSVDSSNISPLV